MHLLQHQSVVAIRKFWIGLLALPLLLLFACGGRTTALRQPGEKQFRYAQLVSYRLVDSSFVVADPWRQGRALQTLKMRKAFGRVVVFTTAHCQLMEYLGVANKIIGVCDSKYILIPDIQRRLRLAEGTKGKIEDCGSSLNPDVERIVSLKPDAIILSPYEGMNLGRLERLGIPVILAADYMETSSLGRAEWMRYYGRLLGCAGTADSLFHVIDSSYQSLKAFAARLPKGRSVLTERKTGAVWYTPGGRSTVAVTIHDANGGYAFADDRHSGSLALSFEQILAKAGQSDVWAFKFNGMRPLTRPDLLREFQGYESLKAFRTGEIYECNCSKTPYFEEVSWRPDYLLREMIMLLHPSARLGKLRYYQKLK